jgi:hypothetical protein
LIERSDSINPKSAIQNLKLNNPEPRTFSKEDITMRSKTIILLLALGILLPGLVGAASERDFEVQPTENIINLCTAAPDDPLYHQAVNFCHGFLVGAYRYYEAAGSGPGGLKLVCLPNNAP